MILKGQTECICTKDNTIGDHEALTNLLFQIKDPFLVIEEHMLSATNSDISIDVGQSGGTANSSGRKASKRRWKFIECFHIIEPSSHQMYIAMNLKTPHYQVSQMDKRSYIRSLPSFMKSNLTCKFHIHRNKEGFHRNHFLTVINDFSMSSSLQLLKSHFSLEESSKVVSKYSTRETVDSC